MSLAPPPRISVGTATEANCHSGSGERLTAAEGELLASAGVRAFMAAYGDRP